MVDLEQLNKRRRGGFREPPASQPIELPTFEAAPLHSVVAENAVLLTNTPA